MSHHNTRAQQKGKKREKSYSSHDLDLHGEILRSLMFWPCGVAVAIRWPTLHDGLVQVPSRWDSNRVQTHRPLMSPL